MPEWFYERPRRCEGVGSVTEQERSYPKKAAGSLHLREALELRALK
jgi:hypothetical protein